MKNTLILVDLSQNVIVTFLKNFTISLVAILSFGSTRTLQIFTTVEMRVSLLSASNVYKLKNKLDTTAITDIISGAVLSTGISPQTNFSFIKKQLKTKWSFVCIQTNYKIFFLVFRSEFRE